MFTPVLGTFPFSRERHPKYQFHKWQLHKYAICKGNMKGGNGWNLSILGVDRDSWEFYLMFMSREINIKLCQIYTKIYIYKILYKNSRFQRIIISKYTTNLKTTLSQRSLRDLGLHLLLFENNIFSFIKDIIDNIICTSVSRDQNFHQWQLSILVTWYRRRHMTLILHYHWWECCSRNTDVIVILSITSY